MQLNEYRRTAIAKSVFKSQDLGGESTAVAISDAGQQNYSKEHDPLTEYIVDAIRKSTDLDDLESALNYGIDQLKRAAAAIHSPEL